MIKPLTLLVAGLLALQTTAAQQTVDASTLTIIGRTVPTEANPFFRIDTARYPFSDAHVQLYCTYPVGEAVLFRTNSPSIELHWTTAPRSIGNNMTPILQRGMDLYIQRDGKWIMAGVARPTMGEKHHDTPVKDMDGTMKDCMLYLPVWCELTSLKITVADGATIEPLASPYQKKVAVLGSSITHGASASRPGMAYPARMSRLTGIEFVNLGFSGSCKLQPDQAQLIADTEADAYLFDAFSNPSAKEVRERLNAFVEKVATAHPDKPMIFMQTLWRETGNFNQNWEATNYDRINTVDSMMNILAKQYKNVYYLDNPYFLGKDHEGTVDGTHPTDLGFDRIINERLPRIMKILHKYGIQ